MKCIMLQTKAPKVEDLQDKVNNWLSNNPNVKIAHITQALNAGRDIITIFYEG